MKLALAPWAAAALALATADVPAGSAGASGPSAAAALTSTIAREVALRADPERADPGARARWVELLRAYADLAAAHPSAGEAVEALVRGAALSADLWRVGRVAPDLDEALRLYRAAADRDAAHPLAAAACLRAATLRFETGDPKARSDAFAALADCARRHPAAPEGKEAARLLKMLRALRPPAGSGAGTAGAAFAPPPVVGPSGIPGIVVDSARLKIPAAKGTAATVVGVTHVSASGYTRVTVRLDRPAHFTVGEAAPGGGLPARLFVDVQDAKVGETVPPAAEVGDGLLRAARAAMFSRTTARIVLDLGAVGRFRVFPLDEPFRVVIDLFSEPEEPGATSGTPGAGAGAAAHPAVAGLERALGTPAGSVAAMAGLRVRRVVVDPGHGGADTGTIGAGGLPEKDVTLDVALRLAPLLKKRLGVEVVLTRDADVDVALEERTARANAARGDLFLSIHANAAPDPTARGIEAWYLDVSSDEYAKKAAARENAATEKGLGDLADVLEDLVARVNSAESKAFATALHDGLVASIDAAFHDAKGRGVRGALFWVLLGARMPAALVELSFLSNPTDAARLATGDHRALLADALAEGVAAYVAARGL